MFLSLSVSSLSFSICVFQYCISIGPSFSIIMFFSTLPYLSFYFRALFTGSHLILPPLTFTWSSLLAEDMSMKRSSISYVIINPSYDLKLEVGDIV